MTIIIEDIELEQLIEKIANADGVSVTEIIQESLDSLVAMRGFIDPKERYRECLAELSSKIHTEPARVLLDHLIKYQDS